MIAFGLVAWPGSHTDRIRIKQETRDHWRRCLWKDQSFERVHTRLLSHGECSASTAGKTVDGLLM